MATILTFLSVFRESYCWIVTCISKVVLKIILVRQLAMNSKDNKPKILKWLSRMFDEIKLKILAMPKVSSALYAKSFAVDYVTTVNSL